MFTRPANAKPSLAERAVLDHLLKQQEFAQNPIVQDLLSDGCKPEELRENLMKKVRARLQNDANHVRQLAKILRDDYDMPALFDSLGPSVNRDTEVDLEAVDSALGEKAHVWAWIETGMTQCGALPVDMLAKLAETFLASETEGVVEEHPPMFFSADTVEDPQNQFQLAIAELAKDDIVLGAHVTKSTFFDLLIVALRTRRNATAKFRQQQAARQAVKQSTEAAAAKRDPARRPHHQETSTTSSIAEQI